MRLPMFMRCFVPQHDKNRRTVIPTIGGILIFLFLIISNQNLSAQKNTKLGELKGIDFKFGVTGFTLSNEDAIKIYSDIVLPDLEKANRIPTEFMNGYAQNYCNSFYLGMVSKNKWFPNSKILKNSENRFGISYSNFSKYHGAITCDVAFPDDTTKELINGIIKYVGYGISADYTINSKPFFKDFAIYLSFGPSINLHNYIAIGQGDFFKKDEPRYTYYPRTELINKKSSFTSIDLKIILGLKYNLSCDFNLFGELAIGESFYPKGLSTNNKFLSTAQLTVIGIRYKFINPEEKTRYKTNLFW